MTRVARSRQTYRLVLGWVLACAVEEGWIEINPALQTRKHALPTRKRERLTLDAYETILRGRAGVAAERHGDVADHAAAARGRDRRPSPITATARCSSCRQKTEGNTRCG